MARIPLSARSERNQGLFAEMDDEDFPSLSRHRWYAHRAPRSCTIYAKRMTSKRQGQRTIFMHVEVMGRIEGAEVDHRDGNGLNNRRSNLRHLSHSQNMQAAADRRNDALVDAWLIAQAAISGSNRKP